MEQSGSRSVAAAIASTIARTGARVAFGHPGGEVVVLIEALRQEGVAFLLTRHENTAAFMAGGVGEITGRAGICVATLGPGATNMVTGVASALLERAPLIALTGALSSAAPEGTTHQALDLTRLYEAVTKRSIAVTADNASNAIAEAIALSHRFRPGPVHLSVPADVAVSRVTAQGPPPRPAKVQGGSTPGALQSARRLLASSHRPAVVVGLGAVWSSVAKEVRALGWSLGAPVATTPKGKGVFPEEDPHFIGTLEMAGDDLVVDFLRRADVLVLVGVDPVEFDKPWRLTAPIVCVDASLGDEEYFDPEVQLVGNMRRTLSVLADQDVRSVWTLAEMADHRSALRAHLRRDEVGLQPRDVVDVLRAALGPATIATSDVGAHKMLVGQAWLTSEPRTFFMANGLSSMGYSIPVAAAARLVCPEKPAVAFVGDGGLGMYLGELETLVRARLDLLIVTFVDGSLELIRRAQLARGVPTEGVSFGNPDYASLARALGITAVELSTRAELAKAVTDLAPRPGVRLIAVHIDGAAYRF